MTDVTHQDDRTPAAQDEHTRLLRLLVERGRLGFLIVVGSNLIFAATDWQLSGTHLQAVLGLKVVAIVTALIVFRVLGRCDSLARARFAIWVGAANTTLVSALSGIVTHDTTTPLLLSILLAWGTAVLLPWGALGQIPVAVVATAAGFLNSVVVSRGATPADSYPLAALIAGTMTSIYVAFLLERARVRAWRAEAELQESEARYRDIFDNSSDLIQSVDADGRVLYVNRRWRETLGYLDTEVVGMSVFDVIHPDSREHCAAALGRLMAGSTGDLIETTFVTRDGRKVEVEGSVTCRFVDGRAVNTRGIFRDVTNRKAVAQALRDSEDTWRRRVETASDFIAEFSSAGYCLYASPNHLRLGFRQEDIIGRLAWDFIHPDDHTAVRQAFEATASGSPSTVSSRFLRADGGERWLDIHSRSFVAHDGTTRILAVARDITERRRRELEVRAINEALHESNRVRSLFSGTMAHELRNSFSSILGMLELERLQDASDAAPRDGLIATIETAARDALDVITITLELSRGESSTDRDIRESVEADVLLRDLVAEFEFPTAARADDIAVACRVPEHLVVHTDPVKLKMVVRNLLTNACKFTDRGCITVSARPDGTNLIVTVADTGRGIPTADLPTLFDPFTQAHGATSRRDGVGLGLFIVRRLVELLDGSISVDSQVDSGTVFTITLRDCIRAEVSTADPRASAPTRRLRVLIAEDDRISRTIVEHHLLRMGHEVVAVNNGRDALRAWQQQPFEVLLLDLNMPGADGIEVAQSLRNERTATDGGPLLMAMTASDSEEDRAGLRAAGVTVFLGKPASERALRAALDTWLAARGDHPETVAACQPAA